MRPPTCVAIGTHQPGNLEPVIDLMHSAEAAVLNTEVEEPTTTVIEAGADLSARSKRHGGKLESTPTGGEVVKEYDRIIAGEQEAEHKAGGGSQSLYTEQAPLSIE